MLDAASPTRASLAQLLSLAWPLIVSQSIWTLQIVLDRIFLAQSSTESVGAGMASVMIFWMLLGFFQFTTNYATTFVAQYTGAGQHERVGPIIGQALWFALASGLLFVLLIPWSETLVAWVGHEEALQQLEATYFRWMCGAALPFLILAATTSFFAGRGETRQVMYINLVGLVVNGFLDYVLIFGKWGFPEMGIAGAGLATLAGGWVAALLSLVLLLRPHCIRLYRTGIGWGLDLALLGRLLYFGVPQGLGTAVETASFALFLLFIGRLGSDDLAATSIACTLNLIAFLPMMGVGQAVEVLVGQSLGEDRPQQAERFVWTGLSLAVGFTALLALMYALMPLTLTSPFRPAELSTSWPAVEARIPLLLWFVAAYCLFDSVQLIFAYALRGAGDTRFVTLVTAALAFPLMVLPAWAAQHLGWSMYVAWAFVSLYLVILASVLYLRFAAGAWKRMRVIELATTPPSEPPPVQTPENFVGPRQPKLVDTARLPRPTGGETALGSKR